MKLYMLVLCVLNMNLVHAVQFHKEMLGTPLAEQDERRLKMLEKEEMLPVGTLVAVITPATSYSAEKLHYGEISGAPKNGEVAVKTQPNGGRMVPLILLRKIAF